MEMGHLCGRKIEVQGQNGILDVASVHKIARVPGLGKGDLLLDLSVHMVCKLLAALGLLTNLAAAGVSPQPQDSTLASAYRILQVLPQGTLPQRTEAASRALLGRPYLLGPLGEGDSLKGEPKPRFRMDVFDCVTFLETSLALASATDTSNLLAHMDSIRYRSGEVAWRWRNHFTESEWLVRNASHHKVLRLAGDTILERRLDRKAFYGKRGVAVEDTLVHLPVLMRAKAIERFSKPSDSTRLRAVGLVGKVDGYPVLHVGFLSEKAGAVPVFRHASQAGTVREQTLAAYLQEKPKFIAVMVWEVVP